MIKVPPRPVFTEDGFPLPDFDTYVETTITLRTGQNEETVFAEIQKAFPDWEVLTVDQKPVARRIR